MPSIITPSIDMKITKLTVAACVKIDVARNAIETRRYERKIRKSQKKIGEYSPTPYCKTITA